MTSPYRNRLAGETSPYLQQHAANPVDWYPWGEEALARARSEDKPLLLSIGYSACHWCHVMAHESFEDPQTAALMNRWFVNVKVDREERPDLDKIYQLAHQMITQRSGGWPLTLFLTPDTQIPFFAGTYFPRQPRYGMPAFGEVLERVADYYREHRADIEEQGRYLTEALATLTPPAPAAGTRLDSAPLDMARNQLGHSYDKVNGGFSGAPKFPHPTNIARLLHHWAGSRSGARPDAQALQMAERTLAKMAEGGIYDQLGGGFCRYSVDATWTIPHFEKMLYDSAQLLPLYVAAWQATGQPLFERIARETADWIMREMQGPEGGYYSTLDADSEGEEGRFYVWDRDEVRTLLDPEEYGAAAPCFGLDREPNFEGRWHLRIARDLTAVAQATGRDEHETAALLERARRNLLQARGARVRPGRDEKILTAWNALTIRAMAIAGRALEREALCDSATRALDFVCGRLLRDGRLLVTYKDGRAQLNAYLDDHAYLIDGLLELLQARWRSSDLELALTLAEALLARFEDGDRGGFFFTAHDHEQLIHRPKPFGDDALPSGNAVAARALGRLGHVIGEPRYLDAAERTLRAAWPQLTELPYAHCSMLDALEEYLTPPEIVILRGEEGSMHQWRKAARAYRPHRLTFAIPRETTGLPGVLAGRESDERLCVAYICTGTQCSAPIDDLREFLERLGEQ